MWRPRAQLRARKTKRAGPRSPCALSCPSDVTGLQKGRQVQVAKAKAAKLLEISGWMPHNLPFPLCGCHTTFHFHFVDVTQPSVSTFTVLCWSNQVTRKIMLKGVGEKLMPDDRGQHHNASGGTLGREGSESSRGFPLAASYSYSSLPQNILFLSQDQPKSYLVETVFSLGSQGLYQVYRQTRQLLVQGHIN